MLSYLDSEDTPWCCPFPNKGSVSFALVRFSHKTLVIIVYIQGFRNRLLIFFLVKFRHNENVVKFRNLVKVRYKIYLDRISE